MSSTPRMGRSSWMRVVARCIAVLVLVNCCCIGQGTPVTPLNAPVASDHGCLTVIVQIDGASLRRGANDFTVVVQNPDHTPGVLTHVTAVMPAHGHTTNVPTLVDVGRGQFGVRGLNITMPGVWQLNLTLSRSGATDDDQATIWTEVE